MNYYGYGGMDAFGLVITLVVLADLILLGVWLWKKITKE